MRPAALQWGLFLISAYASLCLRIIVCQGMLQFQTFYPRPRFQPSFVSYASHTRALSLLTSPLISRITSRQPFSVNYLHVTRYNFYVSLRTYVKGCVPCNSDRSASSRLRTQNALCLPANVELWLLHLSYHASISLKRSFVRGQKMILFTIAMFSFSEFRMKGEHVN